jgi:CCR4-NOT transcription complex subunit 6
MPGAFLRCNHALPQDNVALIVVLEALSAPSSPPDSTQGGRRQLICIANTHIHANPELNDVKLWQVRALARVEDPLPSRRYSLV